MKWLASFLLAASVALAACSDDGGLALPDRSDWCYRFDFRQNDSMALNYGRWVPGVGYYTDENNHLGITYSHYATVNPTYMNVGIQKGAAGEISVAAAGNIFGIVVQMNESIPAVAPASETYDILLDPGTLPSGVVPIGTDVNVTIQTNAALIVAYLDVYGNFTNPFGVSNCPGFINLTNGPSTPTETSWATSAPTWTPEATTYETPTPTPTPSDTPTPTPSWSPTPTPTPTYMYYFSPVERWTRPLPVSDWWVNNSRTRESVTGAQPVGVIALDAYAPNMGDPYAWSGEPTPDSAAQMWSDNSDSSASLPAARVRSNAAATYVATAYPSAAAVWVSDVGGTGAIPVGTTVAGVFRYGQGGYRPTGNAWVDVRWLLYGQPSPTPTPTNTPVNTSTPTRTPTPLPFTLTPAGPTFTPNPAATSLPLPYGLPGNTFRGTNMLCAYGNGSYVWDLRFQSAYLQGWNNPYENEPAAVWRQGVGMELPLVDGQRLGRFWKYPFTEVPGALVTGMSAFSPSENTWQVAASFSPSRNPIYQTAMGGAGWNTFGPFTGVTIPRELFFSIRTGNNQPLIVSFLAVSVVGCPGTPTATQPFNVNPPQATSQALPTVYNWQTPTGTVNHIGTPWGTPAGTPGGTPGTGTPGGTPDGTPGTGTPWGTPGPGTPDPNSTPVFGDGGFTGDMGQINQLGGDLFGTFNNLFGLGGNWLNLLSGRISGIIGAWNTAPATAPPGVPLCQTNPTHNELCAIFYIIRYTILSGPAGGIIMPLATVVLDLFIVFMFIRMLRAILSRIARIVET